MWNVRFDFLAGRVVFPAVYVPAHGFDGDGTRTAGCAVSARRQGRALVGLARAIGSSERLTADNAERVITALALGTGAALVWAANALCNTTAVRRVGTVHTLAWASVVGLVTSIAAALLAGGSPEGWAEDWELLVAAGVATVAGLGLMLLALGGGRMGIVLPIVACDGAIGAGLATLAGATLPATALIALSTMTLGIVLVASTGGNEPVVQGLRPAFTDSTRAIVLLALVSSAAYGVVFFTASQADSTDPLWGVVLTRAAIFSLVAVVALCAAARPRAGSAWPLLLACGITDVGGYTLFVFAATHHPMVAAVATSQYGALSAVAGFVFLRERLRPIQVAGLVILVVSVGVLATAGL